MGYLEYFSRPFLLALALWPFAAAALTVPVLALLYHRYNRIRFAQAVVAYGTVLYAIGLVCFTLYPMPENPAAYCATHHFSPQLDPLQFVVDIRSDGLSAVMQLALNVVFFLPLGFIMGRVFRWRFRVALPFAFLTSLAIETMQLTGLLGLFPCSYRLFDVDDLATNTLGAVIGFLAALALNRRFPVREADLTTVMNPGLVRRLIAFVIDMTLVTITAGPASILATLAYNELVLPDGSPWQPIMVGGVPLQQLISVAALLTFELLVPARRGGSTLGGSFTHMTCETRPRSGWRRAVFYALRTGALMVVAFPDMVRWSGKFVLTLAVFYLFARRMPYDLVPADPWTGRPADGSAMPDAPAMRPSKPSAGAGV
ncbi:VanZ family protein [Bifidobacterium moraviense]|nr:VanZ family protein [Bifidobacterium sp. DSM 109958]